MKKSQIWLSKMGFGPTFIFAPFAEAGKKPQRRLTPVVDWLDRLIGPGGFL
jgi:hypothetical protein